MAVYRIEQSYGNSTFKPTISQGVQDSLILAGVFSKVLLAEVTNGFKNRLGEKLDSIDDAITSTTETVRRNAANGMRTALGVLRRGANGISTVAVDAYKRFDEATKNLSQGLYTDEFIPAYGGTRRNPATYLHPAQEESATLPVKQFRPWYESPEYVPFSYVTTGSPIGKPLDEGQYDLSLERARFSLGAKTPFGFDSAADNRIGTDPNLRIPGYFSSVSRARPSSYELAMAARAYAKNMPETQVPPKRKDTLAVATHPPSRRQEPRSSIAADWSGPATFQPPQRVEPQTPSTVILQPYRPSYPQFRVTAVSYKDLQKVGLGIPPSGYTASHGHAVHPVYLESKTKCTTFG